MSVRLKEKLKEINSQLTYGDREKIWYEVSHVIENKQRMYNILLGKITRDTEAIALVIVEAEKVIKERNEAYGL